MQVAGLRTAKDDYSDIKKIIADMPDGDMLFSLRVGEDVYKRQTEACVGMVGAARSLISGKQAREVALAYGVDPDKPCLVYTSRCV